MVSFAEMAARAAAAPPREGTATVETQAKTEVFPSDGAVSSAAPAEPAAPPAAPAPTPAPAPAPAPAPGTQSPAPSQADTNPEGAKTVTGAAPWLPELPPAPVSGWGIEHVVLDASPLLAGAGIEPLRAAHVWVPSAVAREVKDQHAREAFERMKLILGPRLHILSPPSAALARVRTFARQTGDLAVLSGPDLDVIALALSLELAKHGEWRIRDRPGGQTGQQAYERARAAQAKQEKQERGAHSAPAAEASAAASAPAPAPEPAADQDSAESQPQPTAQPAPAPAPAPVPEPAANRASSPEPAPAPAPAPAPGPHVAVEEKSAPAEAPTPSAPTKVEKGSPTAAEQSLSSLQAARAAAEAEAEEDSEGEGGEWITSDNVGEHKSVAAGLVTEAQRAEAKAAPAGDARPKKPLGVACVSGDFAVQNVLLSMGVALVSLGGKRVTKVQSWMLRCHGCMKLCRDVTRKFCPVCGGATLTRVSVTATGKAPSQGGAVAGSAAAMGVQVHLKANYQPKTRGLVYSLPAPKMGKAAAGPSRGGTGRGQEPILREDQKEWQRALHKDAAEKSKAARRAQKAAEEAKRSGADAAFGAADGWGSFADLTSTYMGLPPVGMGRRNANEKRRARK